MKSYLFILLCFMVTIQSLSAACGSIIYVNDDAMGLNNGSSWDNAYVDLQSALNEAKICTGIQEIWVAEGMYKPTVAINGSPTSETQNRLFNIDFEVKLYGGFCGWETDRKIRTKYLCPSILSGDHNEDDVLITDMDNVDFPFSGGADNSYNIMRMKNLSEASVLDGFTLTGGNAFHPTQLSKRIGAAIFNDGRGVNDMSNPVISNCVFQYNKARVGGGAIYNFGVDSDASPLIRNCEFRYNHSVVHGGALYNLSDGNASNSKPEIRSCLFERNLAAQLGGALYANAPAFGNIDPELSNSTFVHNRANEGGAMYLEKVSAFDEFHFSGCIFYYNIDVQNNGSGSWASSQILMRPRYCIFPEAVADTFTFNSNANPQFLDSLSNFRLQASSPAIDATEQGEIIIGGGGGPISYDLDANSRSMGLRRDIGAYEFLSCPLSNSIYVDDNQVSSPPSGSSEGFDLRSLNAALEMACNCSEKPSIYVSEGMYIPHRLDSMKVPDLDDRHKSTFSIECPVDLYGGQSDSFINPATGPSILDADINQNDNSFQNPGFSDNIRTVMVMRDASTGSTVTGFNFENGRNFIDFQSPSKYGASALDIALTTSFNLVIKDCEFRSSLNSNGATIDITSMAGTSSILFEDCKMLFNEATRGAAISFSGSDNSNCNLQMSRCKIEGNVAVDNFTGGQESPLLFTTTSDGQDQLHLSNCEFGENNDAEQGGGVSIVLQGTGDYTVDVNECVFYNNQAQGMAGALLVRTSTKKNVNIRNCYFDTNTSISGGAIGLRTEGQGSPVLSNCIFRNNKAISDNAFVPLGGAMFVTSTADPVVVNCTFYENSTSRTETGGAIYKGGNEPWTVNNSLFWNNTDGDGQVSSVEANPGGAVTLSYCLIEESSCDLPHMDNVACTSTILGQDPNLDLNSLTRRYAPMEGSPAINAGDNENLPEDVFDFVGTRYDTAKGPDYRIRENRIDIGAYEYQGSFCLDNVILNPLDILFLDDELIGAWTASESITIMPGFSTSQLKPLILDAPEVIIMDDYEFMSQKTLEIVTKGCSAQF